MFRKSISTITWALVATAVALLTACGGGGSAPSSDPVPGVPSASFETKESTVTLDSVQAALININNSGVAPVMTIDSLATGALGNIEAGQALLVPAGQDSRFPLGWTAVAEMVSTNSLGQKLVILKAATLSDVYRKSSTKQAPITLSAENFVGAIAPVAVRGSGDRIGPAKVGLVQERVTALNGALTLRPLQTGAAEKLMNAAGIPSDLGPGELKLQTSFLLRDLFSEDPDAISRLKPYGVSGDVKLVVDIKLSNLSITADHEFQKIVGVPYDLKSVDMKLSGELTGEAKFTGGVETTLGYFSQAWNEVDNEQFDLLGQTVKLKGLDSGDKIGKIPLAGLVFSIPCSATSACPVSEGQTQTPLQLAKSGGVILWLYVNGKGDITFEGELGAQANAKFSMGFEQPVGGSLDAVGGLTRASGLSSADNFLEAPFFKGEAAISGELGPSVGADLFIGGVRVAKINVDLMGRSTLSAKGEFANVKADLNDEKWIWVGNTCLRSDFAAGVMSSFELSLGVEVNTKWENSTEFSYGVQYPSEAEILVPGTYRAFGVPIWKTFDVNSVCVPTPVVDSVAVARSADALRWAVTGVNLPDDLQLTVNTADVCVGGVTASILGADAGTKVSFSCLPTPQIKDIEYQLSSVKASNLDTSAITGRWTAAMATINASANDATIGQTILVWLTSAYDAVKTVVWSFGDAIADAVRVVTGGSSEGDKADVMYATAGQKTITATYKDANNNTVGVSTVTVLVTAEPPAPSIAQALKQTDGTVVVSGTALAGEGVRITWPNGVTDTVLADASTAAWAFASASTAYLAGESVSVVAFAVSGTSSPSLAVIAGESSVAYGKLPHTGITAGQCFAAGGDVLVSCSDLEALALNSQQDGHRAGINAMSYSQVDNYPITSCVRDNVTGLIWEGKESSGARAGSSSYTNWGDGRTGDTSEYIAVVNAAGLCGINDWRLPTMDELHTLVDYGRIEPSISTNWFLNTPPNTSYWSSSPNVGRSNHAWLVSFRNGSASNDYFNNAHAARLVRSSN